MNKKTYISPEVKVYKVNTHSVIACSTSIVDINTGGVGDFDSKSGFDAFGIDDEDVLFD